LFGFYSYSDYRKTVTLQWILQNQMYTFFCMHNTTVASLQKIQMISINTTRGKPYHVAMNCHLVLSVKRTETQKGEQGQVHHASIYTVVGNNVSFSYMEQQSQ